ncbi:MULTISPECIES: hypothetical protein [unclassified Streptomyces]|uniref:hypothetical protein n=1 Tax=unclassified Streptomyces TaxID=2593676 RepID=UPI00332E182E
MKNETIAIIGWITAVQGALGAGGRLYGDGPWGLLHPWWDIPTAGYVVLFAVGAVIALVGETGRKRAKA